MSEITKKSKMEHFFEFPASIGSQGNTPVILMTIPGRTLARTLSPDNYGHVLDRSQREINDSRVKKFYNYLVESNEKNLPFIVPPLVGNCDGHVEFEFFGNTRVGIVRIPMDAQIKLFDGQHRAKGIEMFCRNSGASLSVPLMLTQQLSLETRQQFFCDINNNVSKPAATINMAYNGRDDVAQMMSLFIRKWELFTGITDFEHNVVPPRSSFWVSFKAFCDATSKFIGEGDNRLTDDSLAEIWLSWSRLTAIDYVSTGIKQSEYKKDYLQFHAVMINAFGFAVQRLLESHSIQEVISLIDHLSTNSNTNQIEDFFLIKNWGGICANTDKENPTVIASVSAQKAAAERLVTAIEAGTFTSQ